MYYEYLNGVKMISEGQTKVFFIILEASRKFCEIWGELLMNNVEMSRVFYFLSKLGIGG